MPPAARITHAHLSDGTGVVPPWVAGFAPGCPDRTNRRPSRGRETDMAPPAWASGYDCQGSATVLNWQSSGSPHGHSTANWIIVGGCRP